MNYLKKSAKSIIPAIGVPLLVLICYLLFINRGIFDSTEAQETFFNFGWHDGVFVRNFMLIFCFIFPVVLNALFVFLIPAVTAMDRTVKRRQFMWFFCINVILSLLFPTILWLGFSIGDVVSILTLYILFIVAYAVNFVVSSRFVAQSYKNAFWF